MKKDDAAGFYFWEPGLKVVLYRFVRVQAVDMQEFDGCILEQGDGSSNRMRNSVENDA
jgi:hypothetical protein